MSNFLQWIKGAVGFLSKFLTKDRLALIGMIVQIILEALRTVDKMDGLTDDAKRATAYGLLTEDLPKIIEYGVKLKKIEDQTGKGCLTPDGKVDANCDGIADADQCFEDGEVIPCPEPDCADGKCD